MLGPYSKNLGLYLRENYPKSRGYAYCDSDTGGQYWLVGWEEAIDGAPPTPEDVAKFTPPPRVDLAAQVSAALDSGKLPGATTAAKASAALTGLEILAAALKAKGLI